jgi:hypothetical protein
MADISETTGTAGTAGAAGTQAEREGRGDGEVVSAREKFRQVAEDVRRGAERFGSGVRRGADVARERYDEAAENLRVGYDRVRTQAKDLGSQVNTYVRENPGKSVLIAAAAGFLLGLVVRRARGEGETD